MSGGYGQELASCHLHGSWFVDSVCAVDVMGLVLDCCLWSGSYCQECGCCHLHGCCVVDSCVVDSVVASDVES